MENKPYQMLMSEGETKIIETLNEIYKSGIPFYLIDLMFFKVTTLVKEKAKEEYEAAKSKYENQEVNDGAK